MERRDSMYQIGSFATAAQMSLKALRLYAQLGLLVPGYVDPDSGYRYYYASQLATARLIRSMREIDLPLATIRRVLEATPADAAQLIEAHCRELETRAAQVRRIAPGLIRSIQQEAIEMTIEVRVREIATQPVLSTTNKVKIDQLDTHIRTTLAALHQAAEVAGVTPADAPLGIFHSPINHQEDGPIEICLPLTQPITTEEPYLAYELPGGSFASTVMEGDQCEYPTILQGYDATHDWIERNGYEPAGSPREIWLSAPGEPMRMEIAWPFKSKN